MNINELEKKIQKFWKDNKIPEKVRKLNKGKKKFYFLDGPPYATGYIHLGTAWNKILKDTYIRFFRMKGFDVWNQPGYDTHGLPIENKVEQKLGFHSKADIERLGVKKFNEECRKYATQFIGIMNEQFEDLGVWMDWNNPYLTLTNDYIEGAWHTFKVGFEKGLLYKDVYPVHVCPRCVTKDSLVYTNDNWKTIKELKNCWKQEKVVGVNIKKSELVKLPIQGYLETEDKVFRVKTQSGLTIKATLDHPFLTRDGWKETKKLNVGEEVAVIHLPNFIKDDNSNNVILTSNNIEKIVKYIGKKYGNSKKLKSISKKIINELSNKNLLPLIENKENTKILFQILGYLFGDGSVIVRRKKHRGFPEIITFFSIKSREDLKKIKEDLKKLGFDAKTRKIRERISRINKKEVRGKSYEMYCYSSSLGMLLIALDMPIGKKYEESFDIPKILKKIKTKLMKRNFLRGYFGAELSKLSLRETKKYFKELIFRIEKNKNLENSAIDFVNSIYSLLKEFGIETKPYTKRYEIINKKNKVCITGRISCKIDNIIKFLETIGYAYCKEREVLSSYVLSYLKTKVAKRTGSRKRIFNFPEFGFYIRNNAIGNGMIWEKIVKIEYEGIQEVADLNVTTYHNFIVNGFVTHNCETGVAYNEIEYTTLTDPGIYVKFKVKDENKTFLVCFTTTPWTLPSNTGIMAKPDAEYVYVKVDDETLIFAKNLVETMATKVGIKNYEIVKTVKGKDLEGMRYEHPLKDIFPFIKTLKNAHRVVLSDQFVSLEEGTGLVHSAPGHGQEDYKVGKETGLPIVSPLKMNGSYDETCGKYAGKLARGSNDEIIEEFKNRGLLLYQEKITHEYPQCWRCNSPLLFMAVPQWFFRVTSIRNKLKKENEKVKWYPDWSGKRFENWLESLGDWPISRQRYWGIPLPIWECKKCEKIKVMGSRKELPKIPKDFHRPYIDEIVLKCECGGNMKRIPDVLDVWFDSGLASWASLNYSKDKSLWKKLWPADLNIEGPDQIRGWWNSQLITSVITFNEAPFKTIMFHGFVLDAHGNKMSKSIGNIVEPKDIIDKYGRDVLRFYLLSSPAWDDFYFNWIDTENVARTLNILRNTFEFVKTYVTKFLKKKPKLNVEDEWILSKLNSMIEDYHQQFNIFNHHKVVEKLTDFILNDFSRWYIKLVRDRVWPTYEGKDKDAAFYTLLTISDDLLKLLAPLTPFIAEQAYQNVIKPKMNGLKSIHMYPLPKSDKKMIKKELEKEMEIAKKIFETSSGIRQKENLKLRWPVKRLIIVTDDKKIKTSVRRLKSVLINICNVKQIEILSKLPERGSFSEGVFDNYKLYLDLEENQNLYEERLYRELTRFIQEMRKRYKFVVTENIKLTLKSDSSTEKNLKKFSSKLKKDVGATKVEIGKLSGKYKGEMKFKEIKIDVRFDKI